MTFDPTGGLTTVGEYRLLGRIGEGGMGVVYLAARPDGEHVALKMLRPALLGDREGRSRLSREVTSLRRVRSPRIAEMYDADPWGDVPYVVTRYVAGPSLREVVDARGGLTGRPLHTVARGLAEALAAVHRADVLHRDVKPSNVLIEDGEPVLIDFGLAQLVDDITLTQVGFLLGTPGYLAPEMIEGAQPSRAADVHGWAATVVFAATGAGPYGRGIVAATLERARHGEPDLSGVPVELCDVVTASLRRDPDNRPTAQQLVDWLAVTPVPSGGVTRGSVHDEDLERWLASAPVERSAPRATARAQDPLADWDILARTDPPRPLGPTRPPEPPERPEPLTARAPLRSAEQVPAGPSGTRAVEAATGTTREEPLAGPAAPVAMAPTPPAPPAPASVGRLRWVLFAVCTLAVAAAFAVALPALGALLLAITVWGLRTLSVATDAWRRRRDARGPTRGESTLMALRLPVHAVEAAAATLVSLLLVALCVIPFVLFGELGPPSAYVPFLTVAGLVAVVTSAAWRWGLQVREGARLVARRGPRKGSSLALLAIGSLALTTTLLAAEQIAGPTYFPF